MSGSEIVVVTVVALVGVVLVVELVVITALLLKVKDALHELREQVRPVIADAAIVAATARDVATTVGQHAGQVAAVTAGTAYAINGRVQKVSGLLFRIVSVPLVGVAAAAEGGAAGLAAWMAARAARRARAREQ